MSGTIVLQEKGVRNHCFGTPCASIMVPDTFFAPTFSRRRGGRQLWHDFQDAWSPI